MPRTSPLCNYFVFFKYTTNSRCLSTLFSALCCFGAQFTILSFSPPALLGAKRRTMYPPASCALFSHRERHIVRPPIYNPNNTLGIKLPRLANTFFCLSIPPKNSRGQSPRLSVSSKATPHNSKCRYGERGAADAKPKAQIILDAAKVSAASGGNSEPKQGQRSQSARGFCPRSTMRVPQPDVIEHFGNADAVPQLPERCLSRKAGIVRCCPKL